MICNYHYYHHYRQHHCHTTTTTSAITATTAPVTSTNTEVNFSAAEWNFVNSKSGVSHVMNRISGYPDIRTIYKTNNLFLGLIDVKFILVDTFHGQMSTPFICPLVTMRPGVSCQAF